jgi:hypothetical protein
LVTPTAWRKQWSLETEARKSLLNASFTYFSPYQFVDVCIFNMHTVWMSCLDRVIE